MIPWIRFGSSNHQFPYATIPNKVHDGFGNAVTLNKQPLHLNLYVIIII